MLHINYNITDIEDLYGLVKKVFISKGYEINSVGEFNILTY